MWPQEHRTLNRLYECHPVDGEMFLEKALFSLLNKNGENRFRFSYGKTMYVIEMFNVDFVLNDT